MSDLQSESQAAGRPYVLVAPTGARRGPSDHSDLPVSTDQIIQTARACSMAGANGLHLHIRDAEGQHSLDAGQYLETMAALRQSVPGLDLQITTEAAEIFDVPAQFTCLEQVRPEWASISIREIARSPELADRVYGLCAGQGTRVQHILYDADDAALLAQWQKAGIVREDQVERILVLGRYTAGQKSTPQDLDRFPKGLSPWMVCAFGAQEHACLAYAAGQGGDVRVGFENSLTDESGVLWKDNAASVSALVAKLERAVK
ncbi:3-keto-5-aminohexanoate cleavage enzyme [Ruegeria denitrificans]|uniref:3-keto-5-aminohexanoate cleavage enzyme n=1 Tax=Ruegeria denitrificans TaxID=1715692 RepID=A0A0N7M9A9_9RHOB|nr:3-keto-5-aminohexanoate cleavage protein [Ruegeria denitrificans]CUJ96696.1 3-keto-5-aminohexanoate cleavage enzyme [Ruegeria denitrificans]